MRQEYNNNCTNLQVGDEVHQYLELLMLGMIEIILNISVNVIRIFCIV